MAVALVIKKMLRSFDKSGPIVIILFQAATISSSYEVNRTTRRVREKFHHAHYTARDVWLLLRKTHGIIIFSMQVYGTSIYINIFHASTLLYKGQVLTSCKG